MIDKQNINQICTSLSWPVRVCAGLLAVMNIIFGQLGRSSKIVLVVIAIAVCAYNFYI
jgi:hypothetical protein